MRGARRIASPPWVMRIATDDYRHQGLRRKLVDELRKKGVRAEEVLEAIGAVPRHLFIEDSAFQGTAYMDQAFPIGCGQTISQPYTVAFQSELLGRKRGEKVLEIGTGSGYQTAVLCAMGLRVHSIERHRPLFTATKERLQHLGYKASLVFGDGYKGLPTHAPFDGILVTCGAPEVPQALCGQLRIGGVLVVPVGAGNEQQMLRITRTGPDQWSREEHGRFRFVPMLADRAGT